MNCRFNEPAHCPLFVTVLRSPHIDDAPVGRLCRCSTLLNRCQSHHHFIQWSLNIFALHYFSAQRTQHSTIQCGTIIWLIWRREVWRLSLQARIRDFSKAAEEVEYQRSRHCSHWGRKNIYTEYLLPGRSFTHSPALAMRLAVRRSQLEVTNTPR